MIENQKSASETLREARGYIQAGWSHDTPTKQDAEGNITHVCGEVALARVPGGSPRAWRYINRVINAANTMNGIGVLGKVNCEPDMTQEKMVGIFAEACALAVAAGE